ncbi:ASCH domain-containing protein [Candidatus Bathyarchaeota archaeon A05DMB-2]|nr:ASCH domain-containing protein [Candidatus Bathyarchaeota archaeon A05DMB-2]
MVLFKRPLLRLVLQQRKTQTRRTSRRELSPGRVYPITDQWFGRAAAYIKITRKWRQRLGDVTEQEAKAEGFNSLEEFQQAWKAINGSWNPDQTVTAYEFELVG